MMENAFIVSKISVSKKFAGVYEYDGLTGYFYLTDFSDGEPRKIIKHIQICNDIGPLENDIDVLWSIDDKIVGLFINRILWAVVSPYFDLCIGEFYIQNKRPIKMKNYIDNF